MFGRASTCLCVTGVQEKIAEAGSCVRDCFVAGFGEGRGDNSSPSRSISVRADLLACVLCAAVSHLRTYACSCGADRIGFLLYMPS